MKTVCFITLLTMAFSLSAMQPHRNRVPAPVGIDCCAMATLVGKIGGGCATLAVYKAAEYAVAGAAQPVKFIGDYLRDEPNLPQKLKSE